MTYSSIDQLLLVTTSTPDGDFHMLIDQSDIVRASGFGSADQLIRRFDTSVSVHDIRRIDAHPHTRHIAAYYNGDTQALARIPSQQHGTDFQKRVWQAMCTIPYGQTLSYALLAEASGNIKAVRAAGTICGLNRLILLVPCHRVIKSDGTIGSYLYGSAIKQSLLNHEKICAKQSFSKTSS